jgi:hypothetical protein
VHGEVEVVHEIISATPSISRRILCFIESINTRKAAKLCGTKNTFSLFLILSGN